MTSSINTHLGVDKNLEIFRNGHNEFVMTFTNIDPPYNLIDLSPYNFYVNVKNPGSSTVKLALTRGSGVTNGGTAGTITIAITKAQAQALPADFYFWELLYDIGGKTFPLLQKNLKILDQGNPDSTSTDIPVSVNMGGIQVNMSVNMIGVDLANLTQDQIAALFTQLNNYSQTL